LTPYPSGIPGNLLIVSLPDGSQFVTGTLIESVPVTVREECPPNPPMSRQDSAAVDYLLIPSMPAFGLSGDGQTISGTFTSDADTWTWNLTRVER